MDSQKRKDFQSHKILPIELGKDYILTCQYGILWTSKKEKNIDTNKRQKNAL